MKNNKLMSVLVCAALAIVATYLGGYQKFVGAPIIGLFMGIVLINIINFKDEDIIVGASFVSKKALNLGIILAGGP